jgi:L-ascorbate metabolism protein UlaG (beta-lactamase superfamily)
MVTVRWTGAAGLEFVYNEAVFLMDPYLSRLAKTEIFFTPLIPRTDAIMRYLGGLAGELKAIMIGHTHFDHALDVPEIARATSAQVIGSLSLDRLLEAHGMKGRVTICHGGERISLAEDAAVTMLPSRHGKVFFGRIPYPGEITPPLKTPLKARDYRHGQVFSMLLELGGIRFLHIGSADCIDAALDGKHCEVLFLCLAGWRSTPNFLARVLSRVQPQVIVPFHYDDFSLPLPERRSVPDLPLLDKEGFVKQLVLHAPQARVQWPELNTDLTF